MTFLPNNWNAIRAFYREAMPDIERAGRNEWGMDAYMWDSFGIIHMTPIESWLWSDIRQCDAVLYPQFPVGRFFVDFANPVAKVAIECDGAQWHDAERDAQRDRELNALGWTVYRFPGWLCKTESDPETGEGGDAFLRLQRICDDHGISRFSRTVSERDDEWSGIGDMVDQVVRLMSRTASIKAAVGRVR